MIIRYNISMMFYKTEIIQLKEVGACILWLNEMGDFYKFIT